MLGDVGLDIGIAEVVEDVADPAGQGHALRNLEAAGGDGRGADAQARGDGRRTRVEGDGVAVDGEHRALDADGNPVPGLYVVGEAACGGRGVGSLGAGYAVNENLTIDAAYSYLKEESVKVDDQKAALGSYYSSKYENSANGFGGSVTYRF